ncbi:MAG: hypothetical protein MI976_27280 [Pseudomonadales bacterium]|nr:hypothetical protein [Pseudomonadales bacterium]
MVDPYYDDLDEAYHRELSTRLAGLELIYQKKSGPFDNNNQKPSLPWKSGGGGFGGGSSNEEPQKGEFDHLEPSIRAHMETMRRINNARPKVSRPTSTPTSYSQKSSSKGTSTKEKLVKAKAAQNRAAEAHDALPDKFKKKTVASNGTKTLSGYKKDERMPEGFTRTPDLHADAMLAHSQGLPDYTPQNSALTDQGVRGQNASTHAEKQLARYHELNNIDTPIGVSREQCGDCRNWFREQAKATNKQIVIADPEYSRIYNTDGSVEIYDTNNKLLKTVSNDTPPVATIRKYEGIIW